MTEDRRPCLFARGPTDQTRGGCTGHYDLAVSERTAYGLFNFGLTDRGDDGWRVWKCDTCGHIALFKVKP